MNRGEKIFDDTPKRVFRHYKRLEEVGLAAPEVTYLMHELRAQASRSPQISPLWKRQPMR